MVLIKSDVGYIQKTCQQMRFFARGKSDQRFIVFRMGGFVSDSVYMILWSWGLGSRNYGMCRLHSGSLGSLTSYVGKAGGLPQDVLVYVACEIKRDTLLNNMKWTNTISEIKRGLAIEEQYFRKQFVIGEIPSPWWRTRISKDQLAFVLNEVLVCRMAIFGIKYSIKSHKVM